MHKKWTRRVAGQKKLPSRAFVTLMLHLTTMSATTSATWQCRGVARAIAHCMPSSCVSCKKNLPCRFFCHARSLRAEISPSARRGSSVRFSPLVARARPLSSGRRPLRERHIRRTQTTMFYASRATGARETGARTVQNGGGKGNQTYVGQIMCVARFRKQRIFQFCQLQKTFLC